MEREAPTLWRAAALLLAFCAAGLSATPALGACTGAGTRYLDEVCTGTPPLTANIVYGQAYDEFNTQTTIDLKLDRRYPPGDTETSRPVIVWAHGGGFANGDKNDQAFMMQEWSRRGFVTASINYRLCPGCGAGGATAQVYTNAKYDMQMAIRYIRDNASSWGVDPNKIIAAGWSAGGAMSYGAAYDSADDNDSGSTSSAVSAAIMKSPGSPDEANIYKVDAGEPPSAIFIGAADWPTGGNGYATSKRMYDQILSKGVVAELSVYPLSDHNLDTPATCCLQDYLERSSEFLYRRIPLNTSITSSTPQAFISQTDVRFATNTSGTPDPPAKTITITNVGGGSLSWSASGPNAGAMTPNSGSGLQRGESTIVSIQTTPGSCSNCNGTTWGPYPITIDTAGAAVTAQDVNVYIKSTNSPAINLRETLNVFNTNTSGSPAPPVQTISVENVGGGTLAWSATDSLSWLSEINQAGTSLGPGQFGTFQVSMTPSSDTACRQSGVEKICLQPVTTPAPYTKITVSATGASSKTSDQMIMYGDRPQISTSPTDLYNYLPANGNTATTSTYFTLRNGLGGTLAWQATMPGGCITNTIIPSSGSLAANATQVVEVRSTWNPGTVVGAYGSCLLTVSDNGSSPAAKFPSETITVWGVATN